MDNQVKVSIIIPVYNTAERLEKSIMCAISQTLDSFEIVAVNDGSTDASGDILRAFAKKYPERFRFIETPNRGAAAARNRGMSEARGEWIYFCDSDDEISPEICRYLLERAEKNNAEISTCAMSREGDKHDISKPIVNCPTDGEEIITRTEILKRWYLPLFRFRKSDYDFAHGYLPLCLFRRDIIVSNSIAFDESLGVHEDETLFFSYLNFVNRAALSDKSLYKYIYFENSLCSNFFIHKPDKYKIEKNYYLRARFRRIAWEKYFRSHPDFKRNFAALYCAELNHLFMSTQVRKNLSLPSKISEIKRELSSEKNSPQWKLLIEGKKNLSRGKRTFVDLLKFGAPAIALYCAVMSLRAKS